jgi:CDP-diacylglycerol--glycerol-3-phosphate 3-phosphatidyltransferase
MTDRRPSDTDETPVSTPEPAPTTAPPATDSKATGDQSFIPPEARARVRSGVVPIAMAFGRLGITPNGLTVIGFGIAIICAVLAGAEQWFVAGLLVVGGGVFDLFDGALARATGTVSRLGAFFDSTFDRWGEAVVYIGIIVGATRAGFDLGVFMAALAMASAFMVSYTRAKAENIGARGDVGIADRTVRIVILTLGLMVTGLAGGVVPELERGSVWLASALAAIAVMATITVIQRIVFVRRQVRAAEAAPSVPIASHQP